MDHPRPGKEVPLIFVFNTLIALFIENNGFKIFVIYLNAVKQEHLLLTLSTSDFSRLLRDLSPAKMVDMTE